MGCDSESDREWDALGGVAAIPVEDLFCTRDLEIRDAGPGGCSSLSFSLLFGSLGEEPLMEVPITVEDSLLAAQDKSDGGCSIVGLGGVESSLPKPPTSFSISFSPFSRDDGNSFAGRFISLLGMTPNALGGGYLRLLGVITGVGGNARQEEALTMKLSL